MCTCTVTDYIISGTQTRPSNSTSFRSTFTGQRLDQTQSLTRTSERRPYCALCTYMCTPLIEDREQGSKYTRYVLHAWMLWVVCHTQHQFFSVVAACRDNWCRILWFNWNCVCCDSESHGRSQSSLVCSAIIANIFCIFSFSWSELHTGRKWFCVCVVSTHASHNWKLCQNETPFQEIR